MEIFVGGDKIQGARRGDSDMLKYCLENDEGVKDCIVEVFNVRDHGLAHVVLSWVEDDDYGAATERYERRRRTSHTIVS